MLAALRAEGLHVVEHPGWRTHNREGHGAWGPVHGVIIHHTGGTAPSDGQIVWSGRADLPGPCAHAYLAKDGTLTLTGNGRANHAGGGDPAVLQAVIDESYSTRPPAPHQHDGSAGAVDGNARFYGLECSDLGTGAAWPSVQYDAAVRWAAAILRAHGWSEKSAIGHKEWSDWKPDPTFDMPTFRAAVAARLAHPASWTPGAPTTDTPHTEDDMDPIDVWAYKGKDEKKYDAYAYLRGTNAAVKSLATQVTGLTATVKTLAGQLGSDVNTDEVVAAVQKAISDAVVKVDVDVTGVQTQEA